MARENQMEFDDAYTDPQSINMPILVDRKGNQWVEIWAHCFVPVAKARDWQVVDVRITQQGTPNMFPPRRAEESPSSVAVAWNESRRLGLLSHLGQQLQNSEMIDSTGSSPHKITDSQILSSMLFRDLDDVDGIPMHNRVRNMVGLAGRLISQIRFLDADAMLEASWLLALTGNFVTNYPRRIDVSDLQRWGVSGDACRLLSEVSVLCSNPSRETLLAADLNRSVKALTAVTFADRFLLWEGTCIPTLMGYGGQHHRESLNLVGGTSDFFQLRRELDDLTLPLDLMEWFESEVGVTNSINAPVEEIAFPGGEVDYGEARFGWWAVDTGFPLPSRVFGLSNLLFEIIEDFGHAPSTIPRSELLGPRSQDENLSIAFAASVVIDMAGEGLRNKVWFQQIFDDAVQQLCGRRRERGLVTQDRLEPDVFINALKNRGIYGLKLLSEKFNPESLSDSRDSAGSLLRSDTLFKLDKLTFLATSLLVATINNLRWANQLDRDRVADDRDVVRLIEIDGGLPINLLKALFSGVEEHAYTPAELALEGCLVSESEFFQQIDCSNENWTFDKCCLVWGALELGNPGFNAQVEHFNVAPFGISDAVRLSIEASAYSAIYAAHPIVISVSSGEDDGPLCEVSAEYFRNELVVSIRLEQSFSFGNKLRQYLHVGANDFRRGDFARELVWRFESPHDWWANPISEAIKNVGLFSKDFAAAISEMDVTQSEQKTIIVEARSGGQDFVNPVLEMFAKIASFEFTSSGPTREGA